MKRVVITGCGAICPIVNNINDIQKSIYENEHGFGPVTRFDASKIGIKVIGEIKNFDPNERIPKRMISKLDLVSQYALFSAIEAVDNAKLSISDKDSENTAVIVGNGAGGGITIVEQYKRMMSSTKHATSPIFIPKMLSNCIGANISEYYGIHGSCYSVATACASSCDAIGQAFELIKHGRYNMAFVVGAESPIEELFVSGFNSLHALSRSDDFNQASIPFDKKRSGFVMGEGAGTLIVEELNHAVKRNADIICEIVGYGSTCDAYNLVAPDPEGKFAAKAMQHAIDEAEIVADDIQYINAHGTGTHANDITECKAINSVFGLNSSVLVSSSKSMTGHLLGGAGSLEAIITAYAIKTSMLPINRGTNEQDPECKINLVTKENRERNIEFALSNALGFGGHNSSIVLKKWNN